LADISCKPKHTELIDASPLKIVNRHAAVYNFLFFNPRIIRLHTQRKILQNHKRIKITTLSSCERCSTQRRLVGSR
jgi:hypothetical protein